MAIGSNCGNLQLLPLRVERVAEYGCNPAMGKAARLTESAEKKVDSIYPLAKVIIRIDSRWIAF